MYSFLTDEHVPSVFITTLRSNNHTVIKAKDVFGEQTNDEELLHYCVEHDYLLITHDRKDFSDKTAKQVTHNGILINTEPTYLRDYPNDAVILVERILTHYPPEELENRLAWLKAWREQQSGE
jgi:hypothetical protein